MQNALFFAFTLTFFTSNIFAQDSGPVQNLVSSAVTDTSFTVSWDAIPAATSGINVFIVDKSGTNRDVLITTLAAGVNTYTYSGTVSGTSYPGGTATQEDIIIAAGKEYIAKFQALPDGNGDNYSDLTVTTTGGVGFPKLELFVIPKLH